MTALPSGLLNSRIGLRRRTNDGRPVGALLAVENVPRGLRALANDGRPVGDFLTRPTFAADERLALWYNNGFGVPTTNLERPRFAAVARMRRPVILTKE
jgi:hypothetical protein